MCIVGQNPAVERVAGRDSPSIRRLHEWLRKTGVGRHSFVNVYPYQGHFTLGQVSEHFLRECISPDFKIVALGGVASAVLKRMGVDHFKLPHPSGRNRQLNDPSVEKRALKELKQWLEKTT